MCLALGTTRMTLNRWKNGIGCTESRTEDVKKAMQLIYAFLEDAGLSGKIPPVTLIWLQKNWQDYTDRVDLVARREDQYDISIPRSTPEEIAERYRIYANAEPPELPNIDD